MPKARCDGSGSVSNDDLHGNDADDVIDYAKPENYEGSKDSMRRFLLVSRHPSLASDRRQDVGPGFGSSGGACRPLEGETTSNGPEDKRILTPIWNSGDGLQGNYFRRKVTTDAVDRRTELGGLSDDEEEEEEERKEEEEEKKVEKEEKQKEEEKTESSSSSSLLEDVKCLDSSSERQETRGKLRHFVKIVVIVMRWIATVEKEARRRWSPAGDAVLVRSPSQKTFTDFASELQKTTDDDELTFDLNFFKARKEKTINNELRRILTTPSSSRTQREIETAVYGLEYLEAFAEYPLHLRQKLSRVGWFQQVDPKRVIIRQGHPPENFYFLLSGQAVVQFMEQDPISGRNRLRTASVLRRGDSFGELALLHRTRRTATVVSDGVVQLLSIGREDFFRIIMGQSPDGSIPDHIRFLSSMDFMDGWPIHLLTKHPDQCMFLYFKRGTAIVKDGTKSDWIYVVKSGSCRVLKRLVACAPQNNYSQRGRRRSVVEERRHRPTINSSSSSAFANIVRQSSLPTTNTSSLLPSVAPRTDQKSTGDGCKKRLRRRMRWYSFAEIPLDVSLTFPDSGSARSKSAKASEESVFIEVEVIQEQGVFGLRNLSFDADFDAATGVETSFSLVSNGAECVMLSKRLFIDHSTASIRSRIQRQVRPYPGDEVLQENLQTQVNWNAYKRRLIRSCVMHRSSSQPR